VSMRLAEHERRLLGAYGRRQLAWDASLAVRLVVQGQALGVYTAPPTKVLGFVALPVGDPEPEFDTTVTLESFIAMIESSDDGVLDISALTDAPVSAAAGVATLPPACGWQIPIQGVAGDLWKTVQEAVAEFTERSRGATPAAQQSIADEIWDRPAWGGLPMRVLHSAQRLGFLGNDQSKVAAATCGTWRRFSTVRGQVFYRYPGDTARFDLHVVR
jgi:hypothetical protein